MGRAWLGIVCSVLAGLSACAPVRHLRSQGLAPLPVVVPRALQAPARGAEEAPGLGRRIVLFVPDRALDLADVVSFGIGVGAGVDVHRQITCGLHVPTLGVYTSFNPINWYYKRNLCWCIRSEEEAGLFNAVYYKSKFRGGGTGWDHPRAGGL